MSEIQTAELTRRVARSLGVKDTSGYGLIEGIQPVLVVGDLTNPGQRDLFDVNWYVAIESAGVSGFAVQYLIQNNSPDWITLEEVELFNQSASDRSIIAAIGSDQPAVNWFGTSCPELVQGTNSFSVVRQVGGFGQLATPGNVVRFDAVRVNERWRMQSVPVPPRAYFSLFLGSAVGNGQIYCNARGSVPLQAG